MTKQIIAIGGGGFGRQINDLKIYFDKIKENKSEYNFDNLKNKFSASKLIDDLI